MFYKIIVSALIATNALSAYARHKDDHRIYKSFSQCNGTYSSSIFTTYPVEKGKVLANNTVEKLTGKYLGCRSDLGELADGTVVKGKPFNGKIGIRYHKYQATDKVDLILNGNGRGSKLSQYKSATGEMLDLHNFHHVGIVDVAIKINVENIKTLVVFDVIAEHGCIDKKKHSALIAAFRFTKNNKIGLLHFRMNPPCRRNYEITSDHVVQAYPYEIILLMRLKTHDEQYFYRVKKYIGY